jgi:hypothetical protein
MPHTTKFHREDKAAHERRNFIEFCEASRMKPIPGSIRQPDPPDILVDIEGSGPRAFELVRINHADELLSTTLLRESSHFLADQFAQLPDGQRARLTSMYADAHVLLQFRQVTNPVQRKQALKFVWTLLAASEVGAKGMLFRASNWLVTCVPSHLEMVYVSRLAGQADGPLFNTQAASFVYPVQVTPVIDKLHKRYRSAAPLDLIAYTDGGEFSFSTDLPALAEAVKLHLPGSAFTRIWAFEEMHSRATLVGESA